MLLLSLNVLCIIMVVPDSMNLALWQTCMLLGKIVYLAEVNISKCLEKDTAR